MVVNDKIDLRAVIRNYLKSDGFTNLSVSENGRSALRKAAGDPPDLIIADTYLPGLSGLELLREIRQNRSLKRTPFILLSPETDHTDVAKAAEYGVSAFVVKPFTHRTLLEKVEHLLRRRMNPAETDLIYHEANVRARSDDLESALEKYEEALDDTRNALANLHFKAAKAHESLRQEKLAEENYIEAIKLNDSHVESYGRTRGP